MGVREPILIATVASAPDLADGSGGILRWYVRSQEESAALAEYLSWKEGIMNAGYFSLLATLGKRMTNMAKEEMRHFESDSSMVLAVKWSILIVLLLEQLNPMFQSFSQSQESSTEFKQYRSVHCWLWRYGQRSFK